jgi:hypothetical protein
MAYSNFLNINLSAQCENLAGEINKTYQHLPWALKHEAVSRLKRQVHTLSRAVGRARESKNVLRTQKDLQDAIALTHECVPLMSLCLKKNLLSAELYGRWVKHLNNIEEGLDEWLRASMKKP